METLLIFWIPFIVKYPEYRPQKSYITFGLIAFLIAITISSIFGVDFNLSFWGDVERMLGVFHVIHFFIFYLIATSVFTTWEDWKWLIIDLLAVSAYIAIDTISGSGDDRGGSSYSVIGNVAYVAGLMIFAAFSSVLLFVKSTNKKLGSLWLLPTIIYSYEIYNAKIGGAYGGLLVGIFTAVFLYGLLAKNLKIKYTTISLFIAMVLFSLFFFFSGNNFLEQKFSFFARIRGELSLQKSTAQTRLISWRGGMKELLAHPFFGNGFGNYAAIFDKHFSAKFYNYSRGETYFDRAHNNIIDIAATSGFIGLFAYLSIFIATGYYLIISYRKNKINIHEFVIISSLIIAYFVQNLAVFDSFVTYTSLMVVLGYLYWQNKEVKTPTSDADFNNNEITTFAVSFIILGTIMFQYNIKPWQMLTSTIEGQRVWAMGDGENTYNVYKKALEENTVLDRDSRTSFVRLFSYPSAQFSKLDKKKRDEIMDYVIKQAEANVKYNENDSMNQMTLAQVLSFAASQNTDNQSKYAYYSDWALKAIDKSIEASPERVPVYFQKAQILISRNEKDKAIETMKYALSLNENYYDSYCYLSRIYSYYNEEKEGVKYMDGCIDKGGTELLSPEGYVQNLISTYQKRKDTARVLKLKERLTILNPKDYKLWIDLAKSYAAIGSTTEAIAAVEKAKEINPGIGSEADKFIKNLK